jgi:outer membrane usher protein
VGLKSELTVGQSSTQADVFDSVSYTGAQLATESDMLPDSERGYAPVVRGTAHSNAQVVVRQNGYVIYQNTVPPARLRLTISTPPAAAAI